MSVDDKPYTLFGQLSSQSLVDIMLGYSDEPKANHDLRQRFFKVFAEKNFDDLEVIVNEKPFTYNNGRIEGINNKIKVLNHVAYGYQNFTNFKNRMLLHFKYKSVEPQKKIHKIKHMFQLLEKSRNM